ncbi:DUF2254 domain-containing protein [Isoalcanivorax beigongshangi]|uniref:DUF2254 domain-containing protein n=1 Tax=Isoalcanivorax beigongshangi TaxID=3238810 RepID=A0ABV4ACR4_9GAMM
MNGSWRWALRQWSRQLWVRAALFALLGVATALLGLLGQWLVPADLDLHIGAKAVDSILNVLASSMLAVTTFSLSVMVSAYAAASSGVTPRATKLLMQDSTTQNVLATFIGSFLFSLVGLVALSTGSYGDSGRIIMFVMTLLVLALIVLTLLRWIEHLSSLGRVGETTERVEKATRQALAARRQRPTLGGNALTDRQPIPANATPVYPTAIGYVQFVDVAKLATWAESAEAELYVTAMPGRFVHLLEPLLWISGAEADADALLPAFALGDERSFDQDPRFGLVVLSEIASRALSPAVNDPGTAIDVIGRATRLLELCPPEEEFEVEYPRLWIPALQDSDLFDDLFNPIARDGAGLLEVQLRLQKSLHALALCGPGSYRSAAHRHARRARTRALQALVLDDEKAQIEQQTRWLN